MLALSLSIKRTAFFVLLNVMVAALLPMHACEVVVEETPDTVYIDYDVFDFSQAMGSTRMVLRNTGATECTVAFTVLNNQEAPQPFRISGAGIDLQMSIPELPQTSNPQRADGVHLVIVAPLESRTLSLDFNTEQHLSVPADTYTANLTLSVASAPDNAPFEILPIDVVLRAAPRAQVNIAGAAGNFGHDTYTDMVFFEDPARGDTRRIFVQSRSNATTQLTLSSKNGSRMVHSKSPDSYIAYDVRLGDTPIDLSQDVIIPNRSATNLAGVSEPLDITIDGLHQPYAGDYRDTIYVTIVVQ